MAGSAWESSSLQYDIMAGTHSTWSHAKVTYSCIQSSTTPAQRRCAMCPSSTLCSPGVIVQPADTQAHTLWPAAGAVLSDYASASATADTKATPPAATRLPPSRFGSSALEDVAEGEELRRR